MATNISEIPQIPSVDLQTLQNDLHSSSPPRILSTDKKALKAGGLMLAQAAQPVLPTDPVDIDLEYQLVLIG